MIPSWERLGNTISGRALTLIVHSVVRVRYRLSVFVPFGGLDYRRRCPGNPAPAYVWLTPRPSQETSRT